jgi:DNA polymerase alpha subunit A
MKSLLPVLCTVQKVKKKKKRRRILLSGHFSKTCVSLVLLEKVEDLDSLENARFAVVRPWGTTRERPSGLDEAVQKGKQDGLMIRVEDSEYGLLNYLCGKSTLVNPQILTNHASFAEAKIHLYDPDVIVGHGFSRFTLDVLLRRMKACKTSFWHKIGRLRWKE